MFLLSIVKEEIRFEGDDYKNEIRTIVSLSRFVFDLMERLT